MWKRFLNSLKELLSPGGYERRYNRYHEQLTGSPPPPAHQQHSTPRRKTGTATKAKKASKGIRSLTRTIKRLNKPFHAKGAKRGMKY